MAVNFVIGAGSGALSYGGSYSFSSPNTTGSNRGVIVIHQGQDEGGVPGAVSGITYGGVPMAQVRADTTGTSPAVRQEVWFLAGQATGVQTVAVTLASDQSRIAGVLACAGDSAALEVAAHNGAAGNSTTPTVTVSGTAAGQQCLGGACRSAGGTWTAGTDQTERWDNTQFGEQAATGSNEAVAGTSVTHSYTASTSAPWVCSAASLREAGAPPVSQVPRSLHQYRQRRAT